MLSIHWLYRRSRNYVVKILGWHHCDVTYDVNFQYGGRQRIGTWFINGDSYVKAGNRKVCKKKNISWLYGADRKIRPSGSLFGITRQSVVMSNSDTRTDFSIRTSLMKYTHILPTFSYFLWFRLIGMVSWACLPSNAYFSWTPDYTLLLGSMSIRLNILICHLSVNPCVCSIASVHWPQTSLNRRLIAMNILLYLHSPTVSLDEPILDQRGSYTDERHSFTRRYA